MDFYFLTFPFQGLSAGEINEFWSKNPLLAEELFAEEEAFVAFMAAKREGNRRRTSSRRHSSGGDGGSGSAKKLPLSRQSSVCSVGSNSGSESKDCLGDSLDEFEFEEKLRIGEDDKMFQKMGPTNGVPAPEAKNGNDFLAPFIGGAKTTNGPKSTTTPSSGGKKFAKKSQKERKKELLKLADSDQSQNSPEKTVAWSGWRSAGSPQNSVPIPGLTSPDQPTSSNTLRQDVSLSEIMKAEMPSPVASQSGGGGARSKIKKSSWKQLSYTESDSPRDLTAPAVNPWKTIDSPPATNGIRNPGSSETSTPFVNILKDEVRQTANLFRAKSKSLEVTQLEEKAIMELMKFYSAKSVQDEIITVERVDEGPLATPVWNKGNLQKLK